LVPAASVHLPCKGYFARLRRSMNRNRREDVGLYTRNHWRFRRCLFMGRGVVSKRLAISLAISSKIR
jgi:hypothetical protein